MNSYTLAELAQTLFEDSGDALFLFDPESEQLLDVNPMAQRLTGLSRAQLLEHPVTYLFRSEAAGGLARLRQAYRKTGLFHSQEGFWLRHRDEGTWVPVNLTVTRLHASPRTLGLVTARDISAHRQAQQQLKKTEEQLREVLGSVSDCLWSAEVSDEGQLVGLYCSPVAERLTGRPAASFARDPAAWIRLLHTDDQLALQEAFWRLLARLSEREEGEYRFSGPDGGTRWLRISVLAHVQTAPTAGSPTGEEGHRLRVDGVVSDVTGRRLAEEEAARADVRFRALVERSSEGIFLLDRQARFRYLSPACDTLLGWRGEEMVGRNALDWVHPEDLPLARHELERCLHQPEDSVPAVLRLRHRDGSWRWIEGAGVNRLHDPSIQAVVVHCRDVTQRKQAEEALRTSEARYRALTENLEQSVFLKDRDLRFVAVNRCFCQELGLTEREVLGKNDFDFSPPNLAAKYQADDRRVLTEGQRIEIEEQNAHGGKTRTVRVVKTPVREGDRIVGVLGIYWDVSEEVRLEEQLRQAQKMEAVGQLAGGVAHDFNNLLTSVLGNLSLLQAQLGSSHSGQELIHAAEQAAWRAAHLTRQLLSFSRRTVLHTEPTSLNRTLDEVVSLLGRTLDPRIVVHQRQAPDLWPVLADPTQLNQVLMNLCLNARDALLAVLNTARMADPGETQIEGRLLLETGNVSLAPGDVRLRVSARPGDFVCLRVEDNGTGIPPEVLPRIFEPFFTTKGPDQGTGLGLSMVFGIVQQHQGWIECRSAPGKGTCFEIYLPRHRSVASISPAPEACPPATPQGHSETILLADDEAALRNLALAILQRRGYQVLLAEDGLQAVELYRANRDRIDLVILDLTMPRLSGRDAFHQIRQLNPEVRVLFASGYSPDHLSAEEHQHLAGFVSKPYRPDGLAAAVHEALAARPAGTAVAP
jgi:PAS domain S-box-containing protein